jgi:squalene-hopene/tetraprenyl-beta-curcumene cyclase
VKKVSRLVTILALFALSLCAQEAAPAAGGAEAIVQRSEAMLRRGADFMLSKQLPDGAWMRHPAISALACLGIADAPQYAQPEIKAKIDQALDFIVSLAQPDGSITDPRDRRSYPVYSTSICLIGLLRFNRPQDLPVIKKAREYLLSVDVYPEGDAAAAADAAQQAAGAGHGYGRRHRADLNNTAWALEALYLSEHLDREPFNEDPQAAKKADLAWDKARAFLTLCQNLADTNQSAWVKSAPEDDRGGFIYCPSDALKPDAKAESLRSYGSMTYSGLKSLIYAKVDRSDARIQAAIEWIAKNYSLEENPGVGASGLYYYYHTFGKALALLAQDELSTADGNKRLWRQELLDALEKRQQEDGSWSNELSGRWMESIPELSTCYCLMTLGLIKNAK